MLHELVHNVQGPHNAVFYKLLDEITEVWVGARHSGACCFGGCAFLCCLIPLMTAMSKGHWSG